MPERVARPAPGVQPLMLDHHRPGRESEQGHCRATIVLDHVGLGPLIGWTRYQPQQLLSVWRAKDSREKGSFHDS